MREKLMTLTLAELRKIAKSLNLPHTSTLKKTELVELLVRIDEENRVKEEKAAAPAESRQESPAPEKKDAGKGRRKKKPEDALPEETAPVEPVPASADGEKPSPADPAVSKAIQDLDSGQIGEGYLEILPEKEFGFLRKDIFYPKETDIYVAKSQILRFGLRTGDYVTGPTRKRLEGEKSTALLLISTINGVPVENYQKPTPFENLTPTFPHERLNLEMPRCDVSVRIIDLLSPIGKGQRGMIVAQPKVGKTTLLKQIAKSLVANHPNLHLIILLIDERPEEVTDMQDTFAGTDVEIVYSTFDELPEHHKRVSELVIEHAKHLVEQKADVVILLDSITRLTRAYNLTCTPSGRTLSGGLDPAALYMPKRFFGAARCMKEGGSLTILATALQETGSRLDDMVYEEFKGTGNMELVLNRKLSERRIFPAIDILKSSTRRDDLLLSKAEQDAAALIRKVTTTGPKPEFAIEQVLDLFASTRSNAEFLNRLHYQFLDK